MGFSLAARRAGRPDAADHQADDGDGDEETGERGRRRAERVGAVFHVLDREVALLFEFRVVKLDVDQSRKTAERRGVLSIPTVIVFRNGEEHSRHVGLASYETLARLVTSAKVRAPSP